jgi:di/tricarboxylate transporter
MTIESGFILALLLFALVAFARRGVAPDLVALTILVLLMLTGILTPEEGLTGFSNPATITILALFFVSEALERTGLIRSMGDTLSAIASQHVFINVILIMLIAGVTSAFINTTAVVIVFLPVVLRLSKIKEISPTLLLMPLSFGAIIGGASTTIGTSTNLIISGLTKSATGLQLEVFQFTHMGAILFIIIVLYMAFASKYILKPAKKDENLIEDYNLNSFFSELKISKESGWIGKKLSEIDILRTLQIDVVEILRDGQAIIVPEKNDVIKENDILVIRARSKYLLQLKEGAGLRAESFKEFDENDLTESGILLMELIINRGSSLIGQTLVSSDFRQKYHAAVLGVLSSIIHLRPPRMKHVRFNFGDTLLIETTEERRHLFYDNHDFIVIKEWKRPVYQTNKQWIAIAVILGIVGLAATGVLSIIVAALAGAVVLMVTKCISISEAYTSVDWRIIFMLAGLIPLGIAMEKTGTSALIADAIMYIISPMPQFWALFALYMAITVITSVIYNNATAVILAPVILALQPAMGIDLLPLIALLMFAANCCFLTPIGYQTNIIIYGPGQYRFRDFLKVGLPLVVILGLVMSLMITAFY